MRRALGFTQSELAAALGVHWRSVQNWEHPGAPKPTPEHAQALALFFTVDEGLLWPVDGDGH